MSFYEFCIDDRMYEKSTIFDKAHIIHGFTSKSGGVSNGKITGLNLGFRVKDDEKSVMQNYRLVADDLSFDLSRAVLSKQTHTDNIRIVTEDDIGKGIVRHSDIEDTDALITNIPNIPLVIFAADCMPVLMYDKKKSVIAAIHSGWRGSIKGIAPKCIKMMSENFGSAPKDIVAAIGPCIGPCCFEFGPEAEKLFPEKYRSVTSRGKYMINLWDYNRDRLIEAGFSDDNIDISRICTACNSDKFYSYRTHKEKTGRLAGIIMLK